MRELRITITGVMGTGKTTVLRLIRDQLQELGLNVKIEGEDKTLVSEHSWFNERADVRPGDLGQGNVVLETVTGDPNASVKIADPRQTEIDYGEDFR